MSKPVPKHIDVAELDKLARQVIKDDPFPVLASIDGDKPRARPVSPVRTDSFTVYVANLRSYHKTQEIAANPNVELCYMDGNHNQVRISGQASVVTDRVILQEIWDANPLLRQFMRVIDNPEYLIYKVTPAQVRYMQEWALEYYEVKAE